MNYENIILEPEQKDLFIRIVENIKTVPREIRGSMIEVNSKDGTCLIMPDRSNIKDFARGDLDILADAGLLRMEYGSKGSKKFTITPQGFQYYEWLMKQQGKPVERIENITLRYLDFADFRQGYPTAYSKLKDAEDMLWSADEKKQHSLIGVRCREAMQEFADQLYLHVFGEEFSDLKEKTVDRIRAVIQSKKDETGEAVQKFLEALLPYWGTVSDLVQRNVHANEKQGKPINSEDSRRVVFQTMNIMMELHRTFKNA